MLNLPTTVYICYIFPQVFHHLWLLSSVLHSFQCSEPAFCLISIYVFLLFHLLVSFFCFDYYKRFKHHFLIHITNYVKYKNHTDTSANFFSHHFGTKVSFHVDFLHIKPAEIYSPYFYLYQLIKLISYYSFISWQ